jgi:hypothetical protein
MAEVFVSPGVYTQEIDDTFVPAGAGTIGAALIGRTTSGPAFRPTRVNNFNEFRTVFGGLDVTKYMPYAARSYLRNGSPLTVVRVLGKSTQSTGQLGIISFPVENQLSLSAISASNIAMAVIKRRSSTIPSGTQGDIAMSGTVSNFALSAGSEVVTGLSLVESDGSYIKKVLGTNPLEANSGDKLQDFYVDAVFNYGTAAGTVSANAAAAANFTMSTITADGDMFQEVVGGFGEASTPSIVSQNFNGTVHPLFKIHTLADGSDTNNKYKISISNVDIATSSTSFPKFTVSVRQGNDTDENPIVLENFTDVNLDPNSRQYIARVIGDRRTQFDLSQDPPEVLYNGDFPNKSQYIRVFMHPSAPAAARPAGFQGVSSFSVTTEGKGSVSAAALPLKLNQLNSIAAVDGRIFIGPNFESTGFDDRLKKTVTSASGDSASDNGVLLYAAAADYTGSAGVTNYTSVDMLGSSSGNFSTTNKVRFSVPMFGGWDGFDPRKNQLETEVSTGTDTLSGDFNTAIKILSNPDEVDFNLVAMPGIHSSAGGALTDRLVDMCSNRADAFALVDIANTTATGSGLDLSVANAETEALKFDSNYGACYYPWVRINDVDNNKLVFVPPSVAVMGAYAFNDRVAQPWFAPAGFNRGGLDEVLEVRRRLTQTQRDTLYNNNVNPIATFPGQGIVIFGQKTLQRKQSVLDRVNVRRMMIECRKTIASFSRLFIFEPNTVATRERLLTQVNDYLSSVQAANGINEFRAVLDETTTTPDLIDRNIIKGKIFLKPTTAAEIVIFDFTVTPNGAAFSE